jgi:predicted transglutaminase-like cysteine proteinase
MTADHIFAAALEKFHYLSDQAAFGKVEHWASFEELKSRRNKTDYIEGDCDDFASWCVGQLRGAGLPARYVFCRTELGDYHCVAESDGLIFDNRQRVPMPQTLLPYTWISISGFAPGDAWHAII